MVHQAAQFFARKHQPRCRRNKSEMCGDNSVASSFHMVLRSHEKKRIGCIPTLPEEIIISILLLLPAEVLYDVIRYVCRLWHKIISDSAFVSAHLLRSTGGLLVQVWNKCPLQFLDVRECDIELSTVKIQFFRSIVSTCNGLILMADRSIETESKYYIVNPVKSKILMLPPLCVLHENFSGLVFAASSKEYKVVVLCRDRIKLSDGGGYNYAILTVGVDKSWRLITSENLPHGVRPLPSRRPITTTRFMYWLSYYPPSVSVLDIEFESIRLVSLPKAYNYMNCTCYILPKGDSISLWYVYRDSIEVWVLKNCRTEEWVKFPDLNVRVIWRELHRVPSPLQPPVPISWLRNGELILFRCSPARHFFVYDVKTQETDPFLIKQKHEGAYFFPHVKSLVWF